MSKEFSRIVLGPCCRDGKDGDWWKEQHKSCTGSHHLPGGDYVTCTCECHTASKQSVGLVVAQPEVWAVLDKWHTDNNSECDTLEVRSDNAAFNGDIREFFGWVFQHGGSMEECYRVQ